MLGQLVFQVARMLKLMPVLKQAAQLGYMAQKDTQEHQ
jgi:hypothetical protein